MTISTRESIALKLISDEIGVVRLSRLMQENVWDYPRPAVCEPFVGTLSVIVGGIVVAESQSTFRTLETSHPPTYYFPTDDVNSETLFKNERSTFCEWKGRASYFNYAASQKVIPNRPSYLTSSNPLNTQVQSIHFLFSLPPLPQRLSKAQAYPKLRRSEGTAQQPLHRSHI